MEDLQSILSVKNADFGYVSGKEKIILLKNINLDVRKGELVSLIGRNGSGKSTMLRSLVRLQNPTSGTILLDNKNIRDLSRTELSRMVSFVSTGVFGHESMTIRELVSLGRFPYTNWIGNLTAQDISLVDQSMEMVGIAALSDRKLAEVSDGERQRAMIARTLAQCTPVIILDEPTAFLDIPSKYSLISLLHDLSRKGITIIFSSHDLNIAIKLSDKLWIIDQEQVLEDSPEDLIIKGLIARIFESEKIIFRPEYGDFELKRKSQGIIYLSGNDRISMFWTRQALNRNGFGVSETGNSGMSLQVKKENDQIIWILERDKQTLFFKSIYDLLTGLNLKS